MVNNPSTVTITDTSAASQSVTSYKVLVGTATGGPYTTSSASVSLASMTDNAGVYTTPFASLAFSPALANFTNYFAVVEAVNAQGASGNSPEVSFSLVSVPSAPTAFAMA